MSITWTKKYAPKNSNEIVGQEKQALLMEKFLINYKYAKRRAMILYGPPGSGKTSSVYALANQLNLEMLEVNASDCRNKDAIDSIVGTASKQASLFFKSKIILFDELDGISGTKDRGGISAITQIVKESKFPIILTSNNPFDKKFSTLRKASEMVEFSALDYNDVFNNLKKIADSENLVYEDSDLKSLARRAGGDLRGAITDLQLLTTVNKMFDTNALAELEGRKQTESMLQALVKVLKTTDPLIALTAFDNVDEDLDKCMLWVDYNVGKEYTKPRDLYRAYTALSRSDIFKNRIRKWQYWRYLVYVNALMTAGVAVAKDSRYKFFEYKSTSRILKMWMAKMKLMKKRSIATKIAEKTHTSTKRVLEDVMPYMMAGMRRDASMRDAIAKELELSAEEVAWIRK